MKKALWLLAISAVLVFAFAAAAYAGTSPTVDPLNQGASWNPNSTFNSGTTPSPHADYRLGTLKCAICHSVHKAPTTAGGKPTELLLSTTVGDACNFCHVTSNTGGIRLYGGDPTWIDPNSAKAHSNSCTECHAVHGAGAITLAGDPQLNARILRKNAGGNTPQSSLPANWSYTTGVHDGAVSQFCTNCHPYYVSTYADGNGTNGQHQGSAGVGGTYIGHIMTATVSPDFNSANTKSTVSDNTSVAATPDPYCRNCHDSGATNESTVPSTLSTNNNFPHYTTGLRFMKAASAYGATSYDATQSPVQDGVCLKCHSDGTKFVGKTF